MQTADRASTDLFRDALAQRFGLALDESRRADLGELLTARAAAAGCPDPASYARRLLAGALPREELTRLARECTVGETYFFRHPDQYRAFAAAVLHGRETPRLRILSAGCASGEEAYSLAILLRTHLPDVAGRDVRVVGIDLNPDVLAKAAQGRYTAWSLRGVPDEVRHRYFSVSEKEYHLDPSVRGLVSFEERNLLDEGPDFWCPASFEVIFCRNVLMYFTPEAIRTVVDRFARALVPGGFLFLGPAETLRGVSHDFHLLHTDDAFYYQRRASADVSPAVPANPPAPILTGEDDSWVSAISRAADRIARLSRAARTDGPAPAGRSAVREPPCPPLQRAREMIRQERYSDALSVLNSLTDAQRHDPDAKLLRAVSLTNCGQVGEAKRLCHEVLAGDELNAEARYLLALCLEHTGEHGAAMEQDQAAVYLDPRFAMPHLHLGLLSKRTGDRVAARRAFGRALALLPGEDAGRVLLFGGGFTRETLVTLCAAELRASEGWR